MYNFDSSGYGKNHIFMLKQDKNKCVAYQLVNCLITESVKKYKEAQYNYGILKKSCTTKFGPVSCFILKVSVESIKKKLKKAFWK
jgi:hypothetical protein